MGMTIIGKCVQGASHKRTGKECQDSLCRYRLPGTVISDDIVVLAVADGHGSDRCPYSAVGSKRATKTFKEVMSKLCKEYHQAGDYNTLYSRLKQEGDAIAKKIEDNWKKAILQEHQKKLNRNIPRTISGEEDSSGVWIQYGTTLLGLLVTPSFYFALQLGDGDILHLSDGGVRHAVHGEKMLGVEANSLCQVNAFTKVAVQMDRLDSSVNPQAFMLSTDGFSNSFKNESVFLQTSADYWQSYRENGRKQFNKHLEGWLEETSSEGSGDDITVAFAFLDSEKESL